MVSGVTWHMRRSEALLLQVSVGLTAAYTTDDGKKIAIFHFYDKKKFNREALLRIGALEGCCPTFVTMVRGREGVSTTQFGRLSVRTFHFQSCRCSRYRLLQQKEIRQ